MKTCLPSNSVFVAYWLCALLKNSRVKCFRCENSFSKFISSVLGIILGLSNGGLVNGLLTTYRWSLEFGLVVEVDIFLLLLANNYTERKIKEAVWINKLKPTLDKNTGLELMH